MMGMDIDSIAPTVDDPAADSIKPGSQPKAVPAKQSRKRPHSRMESGLCCVGLRCIVICAGCCSAPSVLCCFAESQCKFYSLQLTLRGTTINITDSRSRKQHDQTSHRSSSSYNSHNGSNNSTSNSWNRSRKRPRLAATAVSAASVSASVAAAIRQVKATVEAESMTALSKGRVHTPVAEATPDVVAELLETKSVKER